MAPHGVKLVLRLAVAGSTVARALKVAMVVGPVLTLINHAHTLVALDFNARFFLQTALTFCVPYLVSTYSSAMTEWANLQANESQASAIPDAER